MSYESRLKDRATIQERDPARNGFADTTPTWGTTVAADVPCLDTHLKDEMVVIQKRDGQFTWHRVYFGRGLAIDLSRKHRLLVNGVKLEIQSSHDVLDLGRVIQVDCRETKA